MAGEEGPFDVAKLFFEYPNQEAFSTNLNAQHVNGMTHVKLGLTCTVVRRSFLGISNIVNRCLSFKPAKQKKSYQE